MPGMLIYAANMSVDGFTEDAQGGLAWSEPADDVFVSITQLMASAGTYVYGRRMYETMAVWETDAALAAQSNLTADFARVWQAADKVVYSTTLADASTAHTRIERRFDAAAVADLKAAAAGNVIVGGPHLAAEAFEAGLVDECHLYVWPVILGGRNPALRAPVASALELVDERRFTNDVVLLRYRVA